MKYLFLIIIVFCFGNCCHACLCEVISIEEQYKTSKSVFIARVNQVKDTLLFDLKNPEIPMHYSIVDLSILVQYKGEIEQKTIKLFTRATGEACGFSFQNNHDYLIYTYSGIFYSEETSKCTPSKDLNIAKSKELRKLKRLSLKRNSN
jgi:hypothetical protein